MESGTLLSNFVVAITLLLSAIVFPGRIQEFVGVRAIGNEGVSGVRATYSG